MRQKLQQRCCRTAEQLELSIRQQQDKTSLLVLLPSNSKMNLLLIKFNFATFENHCIQFFFTSFVGIGVVWTEVQMNIKKYTNSFYWADIHSLIVISGRRHTVTSAIWTSFDDQPQKNKHFGPNMVSLSFEGGIRGWHTYGATVRQRYLFPGSMKI